MLHVNWNKLDDTAASAVVNLINSKLQSFVDARNEVSSSTSSSPLLFTELVVSNWDWGTHPPSLELLELGPALEFPNTSSGGSSSVASGNSSQTHSAMHSARKEQPTPPPASPFGGVNNASSSVSNSNSFPHQLRHSAPEGGSPQSLASPSQTPRTPLQQQSPQVYTPRQHDGLAQYLGESGLFLQFRMSYGGHIKFDIAAGLHQIIQMGKSTIGMKLPLHFQITKCSFDAILNINLHQNSCKIWLDTVEDSCVEQGNKKGNAAAVTGQTALRAMGAKQGGTAAAGGGAFLGDISVVTLIGPQHSGPDEVYVDEHAIGELVTSELRSILRHKLFSPHFVSFPVGAGGGSDNNSATGAGGGAGAQCKSGDTSGNTSFSKQHQQSVSSGQFEKGSPRNPNFE